MSDKSKFSILIIDDSLVMRKLLCNTLKEAGYHKIQEAYDAANAFDILKNDPVNLILVDWIMPGLTGLEFLEKIRKTSGLENIPVIMISSEALSLSKEKAEKHGINCYISKPFKNEDVIKAVNKIFTP